MMSRWLTLLSPLLIGACLPETTVPATGGPDAGLDAPAGARAAFERDIEPLLLGQCASCHAGDTALGPAFLTAEPDVYTRMTDWPGLLDCAAPEQSRVLRYATGQDHTGTNLTDADAGALSAWLVMWAPQTPACQ